VTTARDDAAGIAIEVGPGGGLHSIELADRSMRLGGERLAAAILGLVRTATAQANERARHDLPAELRDSLDTLGLGGADTRLAEDIELTTPNTWMR